MSTYVSTDLTEQLNAAFDAAQTTLRQREEYAFVATLKAEEEQTKKLQAAWTGALMLLKNNLPAWIHKYIQEPTTEYERISEPTYESRFGFVTIEVPGCYPIAAWAECKENRIRLEAMRPELHEDEDGVWTVVSKPSRYRMDRYDIKHGEDDIAVEAVGRTGIERIVVGALWYDGPNSACRAEDAAFIAAARTGWPRDAARVGVLCERVRALETALGEALDGWDCALTCVDYTASEREGEHATIARLRAIAAGGALPKGESR